ncbi:MAG TPA: hypothetical protein VN743_12035, partial [Blastocatellia bacterium]|nr:hypothetical protein [Blastocatellia bacterium]
MVRLSLAASGVLDGLATSTEGRAGPAREDSIALSVPELAESWRSGLDLPHCGQNFDRGFSCLLQYGQNLVITLRQHEFQ